MDNSGLGGGFLSASSGGFLDLESSVQRYQQAQLGHPSRTHMQSSMNMITGVENDPSIGFMEVKGSAPKGFSMNFGKGKACVSVNAVNNSYNNNNISEEDEPSYPEDGNGENFNGAKDKKVSPWQRMKWTDNVVRLLIQVVACVGDDGEGAEGLKRKSVALQKKGKWKTVSNIMISKGCCVSPQQCEDKFNDLNKRYKKLNDILGRGTSCRVVENPALMDSMPQLSAKMKEDVNKILSSKHLFYKEICAYHNGQRIPNCGDLDLQVHSLPLLQSSKENNGSEEEDAEENDESEDDESDNQEAHNADVQRTEDYGERRKENEDEGNFCSQSGVQDGFQAEIAEFFQDSTKSQSERRVWIKRRMLQLQERRVAIKAEAFEMDKRFFKWTRFCSKKNRELEISRLENERLTLENERMTMQLKQAEQEIDLMRSEASFDPTSRRMDRPQGRDQIDLHQ